MVVINILSWIAIGIESLFGLTITKQVEKLNIILIGFTLGISIFAWAVYDLERACAKIRQEQKDSMHSSVVPSGTARKAGPENASGRGA